MKLTTEEEMRAVLLREWSVNYDGDGYTPPEMVRTVLCGRAYGLPSHEDGKIVTTTAIVSIDYNRQIVHTKNRAYILGAPDIAYELEFPGAYNRMFTPESGTCK